MKQKLFNLSKAILTGCMALSIFIYFDGVSALFLGECPYPEKPEE
ncbi:MAG: hypothetical protein PUB13_03390 [Lachnospiraceae bacterium]|nr:hypothetical protein [Lachnospiraceae bacterium]